MIDLLRSFPGVLNLLGPDDAAVQQLVFAAWGRCVDGAFADNVVPVRIEGGRLIATVPTETWRRQVSDLGPALAGKVNSLLGSEFVNFIEFRVDASAVPAAGRPAARPLTMAERDAPVHPGPSPELAAAAETIADESLRSVFLAAAAGSLARRGRDAE